MMNPRQIKILIVGCGSLGSSLAVRLARQAEVVCYDSNARLVRDIRRHGLVLTGKRRKVCRAFSIYDRASELKGMVFDGVLVATKCRDVRSAAEEVAKFCRTKRVLFLQNGDFSLNWTRRVFQGVAVCRGVTTTAAYFDGSGQVEIFFDGDLYVGPYEGLFSGVRWFAKLFQSAGMRACVVGDYRRAVWAKLIFSSVMNPLTILFDSGYDIIRRDDQVYRFVESAMEEGKAVARALGIRLAFDPAKLVSHVRRNRGALLHHGSMYHDFMQKKPLEIKYMTGVIMAEARRLGIETPVLATIDQSIKKAARCDA
jgi:2-dehydropantoate 2-reductase